MRASSLLFMLVAPAAAIVVFACSGATGSALGDPSSPPESEPDGEGSRTDGSGEEEEPGEDAGDAGRKKDSAPDAPPCTGTAPTPLPPNLNGPHACGALDFGKPEAPFIPADASDEGGAGGGTLPPGIYDLVVAERLSGNKGTWHETIVVGESGRFTRTRQINASGTSLGPMTYRSGTVTTGGNMITFAEDCYVSGDAAAKPGTTTLPYEVSTGACGETRFQYQATGFRFTLIPRAQ